MLIWKEYNYSILKKETFNSLFKKKNKENDEICRSVSYVCSFPHGLLLDLMALKKKWNEFNLKADGVPNGSNAYGIELMNIKIIINIIIS